MTVRRVVALAGVFVIVCMGLVILRTEQAQTSYRIQSSRFRQIKLMSRWRAGQLEIARLRAPGQVLGRIDRMTVPVSPGDIGDVSE